MCNVLKRTNITRTMHKSHKYNKQAKTELVRKICNLATVIKHRFQLNQVHNRGSIISSEASRRTKYLMLLMEEPRRENDRQHLNQPMVTM